MSTTQRIKAVPVIINGEKFKVEPPVLGSTLRDLGRIPAENQLFEERPGPEPDVLIEPGASHSPKPGTHYYDLPRGTVGSADLPSQAAFAADALPDGDQMAMPDGTVRVRWSARLPDGWTPQGVSLVVVVPPTYPQQAPSGFDAEGPVTLGEGAPPGSGANTVAGTATTHFCWNPAGAIDYAAPDGLWRYAKFAEQRFRQ